MKTSTRHFEDGQHIGADVFFIQISIHLFARGGFNTFEMHVS